MRGAYPLFYGVSLSHGEVWFLFELVLCLLHQQGAGKEKIKGKQMTSAVLTRNDIRTVVAKVVDINTGETIEPMYEAFGYEKFQEFVDFYRRQNYINKIVWVRGFGYNDENGASQVLASEFVGVGTYE